MREFYIKTVSKTPEKSVECIYSDGTIFPCCNLYLYYMPFSVVRYERVLLQFMMKCKRLNK